MSLQNPRRHPRLVLVTPPDWALVERGDVTEFTAGERGQILIRSAMAMPADYGRWVEQAMAADADGEPLEQLRFEQGTSANGLPIVFTHYRVGERERVGVFYRVLHVGAEVVARLDGKWSDHAEALEPVMRSGFIQWPLVDSETIWDLLGMGESSG